MRDDVKIGILLGFLLMVGMFVWWLVHSQQGKNVPVALTGENPAHVDRPAGPSGDATRIAAATPSPTPNWAVAPSPSPAPAVTRAAATPPPSTPAPIYVPVADPPVMTEPPPPVVAPPAPGTLVTPPGAAVPTTPPPTGSAVPGTTDAFNKLEAAADGTRYYTTQADDLAWKLGVKFYGDGTKWALIKEANPTVDLEHNLRAGVKIKIPVPPASAAVAGTPHAPPTSAPNEYVVQAGDTLSSIAHDKLGNASLWRKILELNPGLDERSLPAGKTIKLPAKADAHAPAGGPTHATPPAAPALGPNEYQIQTGDTLSKIAKDKLGKESLWDKIVELNPGLDPNSLTVGKVIKLPPKPAATPAPAPTPAAGASDTPRIRL
jgi:nucleoid-associated protein YgaU